MLDALASEQKELMALIEGSAYASDDVKLLMTLPGVGVATAQAVVARSEISRGSSPPINWLPTSGSSPHCTRAPNTPTTGVSPSRATATSVGYWSKSPTMPVVTPVMNAYHPKDQRRRECGQVQTLAASPLRRRVHRLPEIKPT